MINQDTVFIISTTFSVIAIILSIFVVYEKHLKPFKVFLRIVKNNPWADKKDMFMLDLLINLSNLGMREGFIENISVKIENRDTHIIMKPDVFYKVSSERKIQPYDFWSSFFLREKETFSKNIGFKCGIPLDSVDEGEKKATLIIEYTTNLKSFRILEHEKKFSFKFDRELARKRLLKSKKKDSLYPYICFT